MAAFGDSGRLAAIIELSSINTGTLRVLQQQKKGEK